MMSRLGMYALLGLGLCMLLGSPAAGGDFKTLAELRKEHPKNYYYRQGYYWCWKHYLYDGGEPRAKAELQKFLDYVRSSRQDIEGGSLTGVLTNAYKLLEATGGTVEGAVKGDAYGMFSSAIDAVDIIFRHGGDHVGRRMGLCAKGRLKGALAFFADLAKKKKKEEEEEKAKPESGVAPGEPPRKPKPDDKKKLDPKKDTAETDPILYPPKTPKPGPDPKTGSGFYVHRNQEQPWRRLHSYTRYYVTPKGEIVVLGSWWGEIGHFDPQEALGEVREPRR